MRREEGDSVSIAASSTGYTKTISQFREASTAARVRIAKKPQTRTCRSSSTTVATVPVTFR